MSAGWGGMNSLIVRIVYVSRSHSHRTPPRTLTCDDRSEESANVALTSAPRRLFRSSSSMLPPKRGESVISLVDSLFFRTSKYGTSRSVDPFAPEEETLLLVERG